MIIHLKSAEARWEGTVTGRVSPDVEWRPVDVKFGSLRMRGSRDGFLNDRSQERGDHVRIHRPLPILHAISPTIAVQRISWKYPRYIVT